MKIDNMTQEELQKYLNQLPINEFPKGNSKFKCEKHNRILPYEDIVTGCFFCIMEEADLGTEEQIKKDQAVLDSVEKIVSKRFFKSIEFELEESDQWSNLRIVKKPIGNYQGEEGLKLWVDQQAVGESGDSWVGTVCVELPNKKYLKWDYSC